VRPILLWGIGKGKPLSPQGCEGTISGELGIGLTFRDALEAELGADTVAAMRHIKLTLDPLCLLNPDKVFRLRADHPPEA
jgi:hypothetical protein